MFGLFNKKNKKNKVENKDVRASKSEMKISGDEISEKVLRKIVGCADAREGISEANANQGYAAGEMNDIDGWD